MSDYRKIFSLQKRCKASSQKWLLRQLNDPYVAKSKNEGYRSRAAYKLIELNDKFKFLHDGQVVIDLGCAPGGWLQVVTQKVHHGFVIGIDLQDVSSVPPATIIKGDFTEEATIFQVKDLLGERKVDVILSDMAASACGIPKVDHIRIMALVKSVVAFGLETLSENGVLIAKVLRGGTESKLLNLMKQNFKRVIHFKPQASRTDSAEMYVIALGFHVGPFSETEKI